MTHREDQDSLIEMHYSEMPNLEFDIRGQGIANPSALSAGVSIPGNLGLSPKERDTRIKGLFRPYHRAIDRLLDGRSRRPSLLLSIHSFTPALHGRQRPWSIGVSYGGDRRLAALVHLLLATLATLAN